MAGNAGMGRPKGSLNKRTAEMLALSADGESPVEFGIRIMRDEDASVEQRLQAARLIAPYLHSKPAATVQPVVVELPEVETVEGVTKACAAVLRAVAGGRLASTMGRDLVSILDVQRRSLELYEIERRLEELEKGRSAEEEPSHV
jgi:hypothetical protein